MATLSLLPPELQEQIFEYVLVPTSPRLEQTNDQLIDEAITIVAGRPVIMPPTDLFYVCRDLSHQAHRVMFSKTKFILYGNPLENLSWLQRQPIIYTKMIKRLILKVPLWQLIEIHVIQGWGELIAALPAHLKISELALSVDGCQDHHIYDANVEREVEWMKTAYENLMQPFINGGFKHLKDFSVRWPEWPAEEAGVKRAIRES